MSAPRPTAAAIALGLLATLSGACGLVFEVLWVKSFALLVGATTLAVSLIVSGFLAGLVLGALTLGPLVDRLRRPLRMYALLELGVGASALGLTLLLQWMLARVPEHGLPLGDQHGARLAFAFLLLLPPTFLMGGTLPVLTRAVARAAETLGRDFAGVYALNTFGAVLGCALAGFVLIGRYGIIRTAIAAAAVNVLVAIGAWALDWRTRSSDPTREASVVVNPVVVEGPRRTALLLAFALSGFASISYEVLWFRVLASFTSSSTYTFTALLSVFLLGLVLGGVLYRRRFEKREARGGVFFEVQSGATVAALLSIVLLGQTRLLSLYLSKLLGSLGLDAAESVAPFLVAGLIILPAATLVGTVFPLVTQLATRHLRAVGGSVGWLYSLNTVGGIVGSLAMGLVVIPRLGTQGGFALACGIGLLAAFLGSHAVEGPRREVRRLALPVLLVLAFALLPRTYLVDSMVRFANTELLEVREGTDGTVAVLQHDKDSLRASGMYPRIDRCEAPYRHRQLVFNSISYASTSPPGLRYMRVLAHLPMFLHPEAKDVLQICFGTGTTAGAFAAHPSLRQLTIADLNADVFALAPHFDDTHGGVLKRATVKPVVQDGRLQLAANAETYDVISLEPPPPRSAGSVHLYSRDFYELARRRLRPGGVLAQWIPLDQQADRLSRGLVRAILEVFPEVQLWMPSRLEAVLIASDRPLSVDWPRWRAQWDVPQLRRSLEEVGYATPESLLGSFLLDRPALARYTANAVATTDERPDVEHYLFNSDRPFDHAALLKLTVAPSAIIAKSSVDQAPRFDARTSAEATRQQDATRHLVSVHVEKQRRDITAARAHLRSAILAAGRDAYLDYLEAFELDCLLTGDPSRWNLPDE